MARLYYEAGTDTLDKLAGSEPDELRAMFADYVARSFKGIAPLPKEMLHTVARAKELERLVEYD